MLRKKFRKYFPLLTYHRGMPDEVIGAYDFLSERGYKGRVDYIRNLLREIIVKDKSYPTQTHDRRRLVVGLILEKGLEDDFLKVCWTEEHAPFEYRKESMNKWYEDYEQDFKSKYGKLLK